jgi:membrane protease YdiL (CAAX protease family)
MNVLDIIKYFLSVVTITDIICLAGLILLVSWLLRAALGPDPLADSALRRNNMPLYLPFITLLLWFGVVSLVIPITTMTKKVIPNLRDWQTACLGNTIMLVGGIGVIAVVIFLVKAHFARGLKGFGLNPKTIHRDSSAAVLNLIYIWPIVCLVTQLTIFYGQLISRQNFRWPQHETLESITSYQHLPLRILILITAAAIVPILEEMLFRGLFQTVIRSFLRKTWLSITITSALFAMVHQQTQHWPALFVLSMCLGYSYEKSGSLFRPILIHSIFNAASIIFVLLNT